MKPLQNSVRASLESATKKFQAAYSDSPAAGYVEGRGLSQATEQHRLGYVADVMPGFERMVGRLAIPNICASGTVVGIKFRDIAGTDEVKYDQPTGQAARLFNLAALNTPGDAIAVTEGELDAVSLSVLGVPAVGVPGASSWKKHHWRLFEGMARVVVFYDQDEAGRNMLKALMASPLPVLPVVIPGGFNDVNAALCGGCADELRALFTGEASA